MEEILGDQAADREALAKEIRRLLEEWDGARITFQGVVFPRSVLQSLLGQLVPVPPAKAAAKAAPKAKAAAKPPPPTPDATPDDLALLLANIRNGGLGYL